MDFGVQDGSLNPNGADASSGWSKRVAAEKNGEIEARFTKGNTDRKFEAEISDDDGFEISEERDAHPEKVGTYAFGSAATAKFSVNGGPLSPDSFDAKDGWSVTRRDRSTVRFGRPFRSSAARRRAVKQLCVHRGDPTRGVGDPGVAGRRPCRRRGPAGASPDGGPAWARSPPTRACRDPGSREGCRGEHPALRARGGTHHYRHGKKVAFGAIAPIMQEERPAEIPPEVVDFCLEVSLPVTLEDTGLKDVTRGDLEKAAEASCIEGETMHNMPFEVHPPMVVDAMLAADASGTRRRALPAGEAALPKGAR